MCAPPTTGGIKITRDGQARRASRQPRYILVRETVGPRWRSSLGEKERRREFHIFLTADFPADSRLDTLPPKNNIRTSSFRSFVRPPMLHRIRELFRGIMSFPVWMGLCVGRMNGEPSGSVAPGYSTHHRARVVSSSLSTVLSTIPANGEDDASFELTSRGPSQSLISCFPKFVFHLFSFASHLCYFNGPQGTRCALSMATASAIRLSIRRYLAPQRSRKGRVCEDCFKRLRKEILLFENAIRLHMRSNYKRYMRTLLLFVGNERIKYRSFI